LSNPKINKVSPPKVILAGSGMCNGGRIMYHLRLYLDNPKNHLLIIIIKPKALWAGNCGMAVKKSIFEGKKSLSKPK